MSDRCSWCEHFETFACPHPRVQPSSPACPSFVKTEGLLTSNGTSATGHICGTCAHFTTPRCPHTGIRFASPACVSYKPGSAGNLPPSSGGLSPGFTIPAPKASPPPSAERGTVVRPEQNIFERPFRRDRL